MNSTELGSSVQSDTCATDLHHAAHGKEKNDRINAKKTMLPAIDLFPWVFKFDHANQHNMSSLLRNMKCIKSNISCSINDCYEKPVKAALLKESIHQALSWILMSYRNLPKGENPSAYLESMSDLLAMYIDMELRASKRGQEQFSAISTRLICCLYTYLDNSTDYMVDTLIKIRHMSHLFRIILDPIMEKILKNIPSLPKTEIMYVRYLLGFRLWKMINSDLVDKKQIRQTAVSLLGKAPSTLPEFLTNCFAVNGSKSQIRSTQLLMKHKFDVKACCADFINFCKRDAESCFQAEDKMNCLERVGGPQQQELVDIVAKESSSIIKIISLSEKVTDPKSCSLLVANSAPDNSNLSNNISRVSINDTTSVSNKESVQSIRPVARQKVKKSSDIIIIDITDEDSAPKITKKKTRKCIPWLNEAKQCLQRLNSEKKERKEISARKMKSPALEILKSFLSITDDNEQKKIESNLYSSFNSWVTFKKEAPITNFCKFFGEEVSENTSSSSSLNITPEEVPTISSPNDCIDKLPDLPPESVLKSDRINSYNSSNALEITSEELSTDNTESNSIIKDKMSEEIPIVLRLDTCKTDSQSEPDSMLCDSNVNLSENNLETKTVCEGLSTMVLDESPRDVELNVNMDNCSGEITGDQLPEYFEPVVTDFEERTKATITELETLEEKEDSIALDYTLQKDESSFRNNVDNSCPEVEKSLCSFPDSQFQENTDALSVLASVCAAQKDNSPSNTIKVKDYARWKPSSNNEMDPKALYEFSENPDVTNKLVNIYPEDAFDKVALQVEVISTSDGLTENISQSFRETSNVILNGETIVLMQKSPNSNVYVINKATENKNSDDEAFDDAEKGTEISQEVLGSESLLKGLMIKTEVDEKILRTGSVDDLKKMSSIIEVNSSKDKRKNLSNGNLSCRPNVKQEYNLSSHINCTCGIPGCSMLSHDLNNSQIPLHIPVSHSTTLPPLYSNFASTPELCVPYRKHCTTVPISLPINSPSSLHPHTTTNSACGISHCTCLACTYEVVTHCRQCIHPSSEPHSSYIEGNSYFIPQHSSVQTSAVQELERTKGNPRIANLYEDQLRCKIEPDILKSKPLEDVNMKFKPEVKYQLEINNKLPLKKRLKAFSTLQKPYDLSMKMKSSINYPGTPMMSIANLEVQADPSVMIPPEIGATVELTTAKEDSTPIENRHHSGEIIRRDYRKDLVHHHGTEKIRGGSKDQRRLLNSQLSNVPHYHDSRYQRDIKISMTRKESEMSPLKRLSVTPSPQEQSAKKAKKSTSRQTRSSQRNVPKVNYSYTEVDPEWNPSGDMKRKRKKTSR